MCVKQTEQLQHEPWQLIFSPFDGAPKRKKFRPRAAHARRAPERANFGGRPEVYLVANFQFGALEITLDQWPTTRNKEQRTRNHEQRTTGASL